MREGKYMKKSKLFILIIVILIIGIVCFFTFYQFKTKEKPEVNYEPYIGVWKSTEKILNITGIQDGKVETTNSSSPYYLIFKEDGTMYSILDDKVEQSEYGILFSSDKEPKEEGIHFSRSDHESIMCPLVDGKLHCNSYAYFEKVNKEELLK